MTVLRSWAGIAILLSVLLLASRSSSATEPTLDDVWSGKARFEVDPNVFGVEFGMHFLSAVAGQDAIHVFHNFPDSGQNSIGLATTTDGVTFKNLGKVVTRSASGWDSRFAAFPGAIKVGSKWYLVFEGAGDSPGDLGLATSDDGVNFTKHPAPILIHARRQPKDPANLQLVWERANVGTPSIHVENDKFFVFYHGFGKSSVGGPDDCQLGLAMGTDPKQLKRVGNGPLIKTSKNGWDSGTVGKRSIIKQNESYYMIYEGSTDQPYDKAKWSSGLARAKSLMGPWEKFAQNPVIPATNGGFGNDGPEWIQIADKLYIYFRSPSGPTTRAVLVWK